MAASSCASRPPPVLFFAGGSGLSSPRSMILDLLEEGFDKPIILAYGARNRDELYYHREFLALATQHANFTYVPALSAEPEGSDWQASAALCTMRPKHTSTTTSAATRPICAARR
jgi:Na+-transporting NADH:ubiquinone oxidoreductase subunit NqrF